MSIKLIPLIQQYRMSLNTASIYFIKALLAVLFFIKAPNAAIAAEIAQNNSQLEIISQIKQDDVIYLGENHDNVEQHRQELEIITQLYQHKTNSKKLAIALEMFQRPFQPILDRYLEGKIDEDRLREQTEYETRWGFDWEFYAPILRFAIAHQIPLIALNTPAEITTQVAESGIDSLEGDDFRYIPLLADIRLDNREYRQRLDEIYRQHVENGQGNSKDADNFFAAQVLWDETMADAIAQYYQNFPRSQIAVLVGKAHVMYDYAIPDRVARRISDPDFSQTSLLLGEVVRSRK